MISRVLCFPIVDVLEGNLTDCKTPIADSKQLVRSAACSQNIIAKKLLIQCRKYDILSEFF